MNREQLEEFNQAQHRDDPIHIADLFVPHVNRTLLLADGKPGLLHVWTADGEIHKARFEWHGPSFLSFDHVHGGSILPSEIGWTPTAMPESTEFNFALILRRAGIRLTFFPLDAPSVLPRFAAHDPYHGPVV